MGNLKHAFLFLEIIVDKYGKVSREGVSDNEADFSQLEILVDTYMGSTIRPNATYEINVCSSEKAEFARSLQENLL